MQQLRLVLLVVLLLVALSAQQALVVAWVQQTQQQQQVLACWDTFWSPATPQVLLLVLLPSAAQAPHNQAWQLQLAVLVLLLLLAALAAQLVAWVQQIQLQQQRVLAC